MAMNFDTMANDINEDRYSTHKKPRGYLDSEPGTHICRINDWVYKPTTNSGKEMYILELDIVSSTMYSEGTELKQSLVVSGIPKHIIQRIEKNIQDIAYLTLDPPLTADKLRENIRSEEGHRSAMVGKLLKIVAERQTSPKTGSTWTEYFYSTPKEGEVIETNPMNQPMTPAQVDEKLDSVFGKSDEVATEEVPDFEL